MTFAIFIVLIFGVFVALLNILPPVATFGFAIGPALTLVIGYMKAWNFLFPVQEILVLVLLVIAFEVGIWTWHVSWRVIKFLRGHSEG